MLCNLSSLANAGLLYEKGYTKQDIIQLHMLIDWLITLPEELKQIEEELKVEFITTPERVGMMKGRIEGRKEGLK
ncbi:MAG TPA: hypothetical protein VHE99_07270 [Gammaproteobacteria bacterium]|nr:hypothetical protein [Gammaproteobacteria bacterium]